MRLSHRKREAWVRRHPTGLWLPLRMGTGTRDMIRRCHAAGLAEPEFEVRDGFVTTVRRPVQEVQVGGVEAGFLLGTPQVTTQVTPQVAPRLKPFDTKRLESLRAGLRLPTPRVTAQVATQVEKVLRAAASPRSREELQAVILADRIVSAKPAAR